MLHYPGVSGLRFNLQKDIAAGMYDIVIKTSDGYTHVIENCVKATSEPLVTGVYDLDRLWFKNQNGIPRVDNRGDYVSLYVYGVNLSGATAPIFYLQGGSTPASSYSESGDEDNKCAFEENGIGAFYTVKKSDIETNWNLWDAEYERYITYRDYAVRFAPGVEILGDSGETEEFNTYMNFPVIFDEWLEKGTGDNQGKFSAQFYIGGDVAKASGGLILNQVGNYDSGTGAYEILKSHECMISMDEGGYFIKPENAEDAADANSWGYQFQFFRRMNGKEFNILGKDGVKYVSSGSKHQSIHIFPVAKGRKWAIYSGNLVGRCLASGVGTGNNVFTDHPEILQNAKDYIYYRFWVEGDGTDEGSWYKYYIDKEGSGGGGGFDPPVDYCKYSGTIAAGQKFNVKPYLPYTRFRLEVLSSEVKNPASVTSAGVVKAKAPCTIRVYGQHKVGKVWKDYSYYVDLTVLMPEFKLKTVNLYSPGLTCYPEDNLKEVPDGLKAQWSVTPARVAELATDDASRPFIRTVKAGSARVTAIYGEGKNAAKYTFTLKVNNPRIKKVKQNLQLGQAVHNHIRLTGITLEEASALTWTADSDRGIISIRQEAPVAGRSYVDIPVEITPVTAGTETVSIDLGEGGIYSFTATVKKPTLSKKKLTLKQGASAAITLSGTKLSKDAIKALDWQTTDPSVAIVADGMVTATGSPGSTCEVFTVYGGCEDRCTVTIK